MFNKSEIMKSAWEIYRNSKLDFMGFETQKGISFGEALRQAWAEAKAAAQAAPKMQEVTAAEIAEGDVLSIEYGDYNSFVQLTVIDRRQINNGYVLHVKSNFVDMEFYMGSNETITKVAA